MDHLHEVSGAIWAAMQITVLGLGRLAGGAWGARCCIDARGEGLEDRVEMFYHIILTADHVAVAALQTPDAAADADIDIVDALGFQFVGAADVVVIVGIAAIDQDVAGLHQRHDGLEFLVDDGGRQHEPDDARFCQL
jgi:hypothetical protein